MLLASALLSAEITLAAEIPLFTPQLEQRLQPWCPNRCVEAVPFTATYHRGDQSLVFVAAHHDFTEHSPTKQAVAAGFAGASPAIVIVEGFPTAMGESPAPLVKEVSRRGTSEASQFTKGENIYAASLALNHSIPFLGGEPTRQEEVEALLRKGFSRADLSFAFTLRGLVQSLTAGEFTGAKDPRLQRVLESASQTTQEAFGLAPLSFDDFTQRYRAMFGIALESDPRLISRAEPGTDSPVARLLQSDMVGRDEHLWATIQEQLRLKWRVLVVYGGSHWTTLSGVLEEKLGKPTVNSSFN